MEQQEKQNISTTTTEEKPPEQKNPKRLRIIVIICLFLVIAAITSEIIWSVHIRRLRIEMENHLTNTISKIELGEYDAALEEAEAAMVLAARLRDIDIIHKIDAYAVLTETLILGDDFFDAGNYRSALEKYRLASEYASEINTRYGEERQLNTEIIDKKIAVTEMYIAFYGLIDRAEKLAESSYFVDAISRYTEAKVIASALLFAEGLNMADDGIAEVRELILIARIKEAEDFYWDANHLYRIGEYEESLELYYKALEIYVELEDQQRIQATEERIDHIEQILAAQKAEPPTTDSGTQEDQDKPEDSEAPEDPDEPDEPAVRSVNYEHNISLNFDLVTLIDNQNRSPANQVRMGTSDGMNEGWYNGCGWVAAYNALIILGSPQHPADIVEFFELSGGTVMDGVFGTYPNAIADYLERFGYSVGNIFFPQLTTNIDNTIKSSKVSILAYLHTSAAHYAVIEYREDLERFIVYNDSFAKSYSSSLGFQNETNIGAAVDSIIKLISSTPSILLSFSLITAE